MERLNVFARILFLSLLTLAMNVSGAAWGRTPHHRVHKTVKRQKNTCRETSTGCFSESFQTTASSSPVDLLIVLQTSSSINDVKPGIVSGLRSFISSLPTTSDFNIGVMLSHGSTSALSGALYQAGSEPLVLKSSQLTKTQLQDDLEQKLNNVTQDVDSGGGEEGLFSLFHGITTANLLAASKSAGMFRSNAALGVIFIGDRRDICAAIPTGVADETDPVKIAARYRDCEGLTAAGLTYQLKLVKGTEPLIVDGIIYDRAPVPAGKEIGYGYTDMVRLNSGVAIDIAQDSITNGLNSVRALGGATVAQNVFQLSHSGIDPASVRVTVNGVAASFTVSGSKVTMTSAIPSSSVVVISYCLQAPKDVCVANGLSEKACYLMKIMELGCPLRDQVPAGSQNGGRAQLISYLKRCDAKAYPMTTPTTAQWEVIQKLLDPSEASYRKNIFTKLYYKPTATDEFKKFFGIELYNAEYVLCDNYGVPPGAGSIMPKEGVNPESGFYTPNKEYKAANVYAQELQDCIYASKSER